MQGLWKCTRHDLTCQTRSPNLAVKQPERIEVQIHRNINICRGKPEDLNGTESGTNYHKLVVTFQVWAHPLFSFEMATSHTAAGSNTNTLYCQDIIMSQRCEN